jgi:hypothetical protein
MQKKTIKNTTQEEHHMVHPQLTSFNLHLNHLLLLSLLNFIQMIEDVKNPPEYGGWIEQANDWIVDSLYVFLRAFLHNHLTEIIFPSLMEEL